MPKPSVFDRTVSSLRQSDLASQAPIGTTNGIAITAGDIRGGTLVAVSPGVYRVALGDPNSDDPRYVEKAGGGYWTLDVGALVKARAEADAAQPGKLPQLGVGRYQYRLGR